MELQRTMKLSAVMVLSMVMIGACDLITGGSGGNKKPCIALDVQPIQYVEMGQYLQDVARYNNEVAGKVNSNFDSLFNYAGHGDFEGKDASCHVTFSLSRLKNFIYEIERISAQEGVDVDSMGITWSFAIYDHHRSHNNTTDQIDLRSQQTLYGLPSRLMPDGTYAPVSMYKDFSPMGTEALFAIEDTSRLTEPNSGILQSDDAFNRGNLCPPICNQQMLNLQTATTRFNDARFGTVNHYQ